MWRWRESNPRPSDVSMGLLRAQPVDDVSGSLVAGTGEAEPQSAEMSPAGPLTTPIG